MNVEVWVRTFSCEELNLEKKNTSHRIIRRSWDPHRLDAWDLGWVCIQVMIFVGCVWGRHRPIRPHAKLVRSSGWPECQEVEMKVDAVSCNCCWCFSKYKIAPPVWRYILRSCFLHLWCSPALLHCHLLHPNEITTASAILFSNHFKWSLSNKNENASRNLVSNKKRILFQTSLCGHLTKKPEKPKLQNASFWLEVNSMVNQLWCDEHFSENESDWTSLSHSIPQHTANH